uniref:C2H2-type domain-containing protein n=1 Tax=Phlebotomus papatasi TaxID=29031 RepID=A0A1B0EVD8_PHLPP
MDFKSEMHSEIVKGEYCVEDNVFGLQNPIGIAMETLASDVDESKVKFEIIEIDDDSTNVRYHRSNENDNQCGICGKKFTRRANLEMHMDIHPKSENESQEVSEVQPKKRKNSVNAKEAQPKKKAKTSQEKIDENSDKDHSKRKKQEKNDLFKPKHFSCAHCSFTFSHKKSLAKHLIVLHMKSKKTRKDISCLICQKKYNDFQSLGTHMWKHSKEKPSTCKICGEKFLYKFLHDRHFELNHKE